MNDNVMCGRNVYGEPINLGFVQRLNSAIFNWLSPMPPPGRYVQRYRVYYNPCAGIGSRHIKTTDREEAIGLVSEMRSLGYAEASYVSGWSYYVRHDGTVPPPPDAIRAAIADRVAQKINHLALPVSDDDEVLNNWRLSLGLPEVRRDRAVSPPTDTAPSQETAKDKER